MKLFSKTQTINFAKRSLLTLLFLFSHIGLTMSQEPESAENANPNKAVLAGGCFWGLEEFMRKQPGVTDVLAGYTGGTLANPKYEQTHDGKSGHAEAIQITFDPAKTNFENLLRFYFRIHDPTTLNRQGNDQGSQYRSAIFYLSPQQKATAEKIKTEVNASGKWTDPLVTEITEATTFYPAEEYHQDYLQKHPNGYNHHYLRD